MGPSFLQQRTKGICLDSQANTRSVDENRNLSHSFGSLSPPSSPLSSSYLSWDEAKLDEACSESVEIIDLCNRLETVHITQRQTSLHEEHCKVHLHYNLDGLDDCDVSEPDSSDKAYSRTNSLISSTKHGALSVANADEWRSIASSLDTSDPTLDSSEDHIPTEDSETLSVDSSLAEAVAPTENTNSECSDLLSLANLVIQPHRQVSSLHIPSIDLTLGLRRISSPCSRSLSLDRRLRPTQRAPGSLKPAFNRMNSPDRFILCRDPPGPCRDSLLIKTPPSLIRIRRKRTQGYNISDPFSTPLRNRHALTESVRTLRFQRPARAESTNPSQVLNSRSDVMNNSHRQVSYGAVWNVGGAGIVNNTGGAVQDGRGGMVGSGTNAPLYVSSFLEASKPRDELELYEKRLALALCVESSRRILGTSSTSLTSRCSTAAVSRAIRIVSDCNDARRIDNIGAIQWRDNEWIRSGTPYLLEAPNLRDDFYCSVLAYSHSAQCLAVALADKVYLWTEKGGVKGIPRDEDQGRFRSAYVTSVAFSSTQGGNAILAIGRADGRVAMYSPLDKEPRYLRITLPTAAAYVSFRPSVVRRQSQRCSLLTADNEVLLVGDDTGMVAVYFIEWPKEVDRYAFGWDCAATIHVRLSVHTQQVCGIAWSLDGNLFATGGNDNLCCLFEAKQILNKSGLKENKDRTEPSLSENDSSRAPILKRESAKYLWILNAAVKAIAFCPWQRGLIAAGGGSNDRCIHFYHTISGACLAKINCAAQVTSLIWSTTRREIVATFGFAQPEHPFRIAVYAWPSCQQVVAIPWHDEMRALYAIGYPGGPGTGHGGKGGDHRWSRTAEEGCIVVAGSDGSIKFHEIWSEARRATGPHQGLLGGSDILETLHGFDKEGYERIR